MVVRRDAGSTFQHLQTIWAGRLGHELELVWDRRMSERRCHTAAARVDRWVHDRGDPEIEPELEPEVELILLDQRQRERRQQPEEPEVCRPERRQTERRRRAPGTWGPLGFLVVPDEAGSL